MHSEHNKTPPCDMGPAPTQFSLPSAAQENRAFRHTLWTGEHLQLTVMYLAPGEDIGTEMHANVDQLLRVEEGHALLRYGSCRSAIRDVGYMRRGDVFLVPAGTYHNLINAGRGPLRLSSVYAPPNHPKGTVHQTKEDALKEEH
jgi:mannose-6-phosphate isomerase-like protein (cupin superfamily)